ncbi:MAG TPA: hypothetical protein VKD65_12390 [Candidatus Angelobacter sp.]|nr:hypothetical protein [Candidatus Angelobacter sp.]
MADENLNSALGMGPSAAAPQGTIDPSVKAVVRYRDGYRAANFTTGIGTAIKILGAVLGVVVAALGILASLEIIGSSRVDSVFAFISVLSGIFTFGTFFIAGVIVSALGHQLKASLDSAVNSSPFLDVPAKARAMSLE